jgi:voltage-gated potassium channel
MLAEKLCRDLKERRMPFIVIEKDPEKASTLRDLGYIAVNGDFTDKEALEDASIHTARSIVFATESDFINLLGIVTARHMNPSVEIITRVREESAITKMHRGGANFCLVPEEVAGIEIGKRITGG